MGACGSDMLERLGPEFGKFVAVEKGKDFLNVKLNQLKNTVNLKSNQIKNQTFTKIDQEQNRVLQKVNQTVNQVEQNTPGVLDKAAALQRKSKQDMLGAGTIKQKFSDLKLTVQSQFQKQKQNIMNQINNQGQKQKQFLDSQKPKIPVYDQLPQSAQKKVFSQAQRKFSSQINAQQDQIKKSIEQSLNIDKFTGVFKNLQSGFNVDSLSSSSMEVLNQAKNGLSFSNVICC